MTQKQYAYVGDVMSFGWHQCCQKLMTLLLSRK